VKRCGDSHGNPESREVLGSSVCLRRWLNLGQLAAAGFGRRFQFHRFAFVVGIVVGVLALVETDGGFEHQEDVIASAFDLADRGGDTVGIGKGLVDRVAEFLHQIFEPVVQVRLFPAVSSISSYRRRNRCFAGYPSARLLG